MSLFIIVNLVNLMKKSLSLLALTIAAFTTTAAEPNLTLLKENLNPNIEITSVKESPIPGILEVQIQNEIVYLTEDGEKLISGDIYNLKEQFSYSDKTRNGLRKTALAAVKNEDKIIYKAKDEKYKVTVFTDISCPYCTKFHQHISDFNDDGITVEYLAFPRAGIGSTHQKSMQNIWCAKDKALSLTAAKIEQKLPKASCEGKQTAEQFQLGEQIGVRATPTVVFSDGELKAGYLKPKQLLALLKEKFPNK